MNICGDSGDLRSLRAVLTVPMLFAGVLLVERVRRVCNGGNDERVRGIGILYSALHICFKLCTSGAGSVLERCGASALTAASGSSPINANMYFEQTLPQSREKIH